MQATQGWTTSTVPVHGRAELPRGGPTAEAYTELWQNEDGDEAEALSGDEQPETGNETA